MARKENELDLYFVDMKYIRNLSKADSNVMSISPQTGKENRPFLGIVLILGEKKYCIPLTSPKSKFNIKSGSDFVKIPDPKLKNEYGAPVTIGILNINNMIPVDNSVIKKIDISNSSDIEIKRRMLLIKEISWCRDNAAVITNKANKVYVKVTETPDKSRQLTRRCCDFKKLEKVLKKYLENTNRTD